jgi:predicted Zn-dependent peptidase
MLAGFGVALVAAFASAQSPIEFRAKDGTRFLLLPQPGAPIVHWCVASPIGPRVDPIDLPGLAEATVRASMRGTWAVGSIDAARERPVLAELDALEAELRSPAIQAVAVRDAKEARAAELRAQAAQLSDLLAFRRVLAATPASSVQVRCDGSIATLSFRTTPLGVAAAAKLLVDRRDRQALREIDAELLSTQQRAADAWDRDPLSPLYAELLALAFSGHAVARSGDRPQTQSVRRDAALALWARTQHPDTTVHALVGSFDAVAVQKELERAFASTQLPATQAIEPIAPRMPTATRKAVVPGARYPAVLVAYEMPVGMDRAAATTIARWLADGRESWLGKELVRRGRSTAKTAVLAPWPSAATTGLLVIQVTDEAGTKRGLADDALSALAAARSAAPEPGQLPIRFAAILRDYELATGGGQDLAVFAASAALRGETISPPASPIFSELAEQLHEALAKSPIVVEWSDA